MLLDLQILLTYLFYTFFLLVVFSIFFCVYHMTPVRCIKGPKPDKRWTLEYCDTKEPSWNYRETTQIKISCSFLFKQIMHLNRTLLASIYKVCITPLQNQSRSYFFSRVQSTSVR